MIEDALSNFNRTIDSWISSLDDYPSEMFTRKPIAGSWSIGQVYMHLAIDTSWHVGQMEIALWRDDFANEEMHPNAKAMFQHNQFPDIRIEGDATDENVPQPESKEEVLQKLTDIRKRVNNLCASPELATSKGKTRHPGLLYFSALDWLRFTEMHMRHHLRQKARLDVHLQK
jgi:hypothetical protein